MKRITSLVARFVRDDRGMETVEWAVMAGLIVAALITTVTALGGHINTVLSNLNTSI